MCRWTSEIVGNSVLISSKNSLIHFKKYNTSQEFSHILNMKHLTQCNPNIFGTLILSDNGRTEIHNIITYGSGESDPRCLKCFWWCSTIYGLTPCVKTTLNVLMVHLGKAARNTLDMLHNWLWIKLAVEWSTFSLLPGSLQPPL